MLFRHFFSTTGSLLAITLQVVLSKARKARECSLANAAKFTSNHLLGSRWNVLSECSMNLFKVLTFLWCAFVFAERTLCISFRCLQPLEVDELVSFITYRSWKHFLWRHTNAFTIFPLPDTFIILTTVTSTDLELFLDFKTSRDKSSGLRWARYRFMFAKKNSRRLSVSTSSNCFKLSS